MVGDGSPDAVLFDVDSSSVGAPGFKRGSRQVYDPKSPPDVSLSSGWVLPPPVIDNAGGGGVIGSPGVGSHGAADGVLPVFENPVVFMGKAVHGTEVKVLLNSGASAGQMVGVGITGDDGVWVVQLDAVMPAGSFCFVATQTIPGRDTSPPSVPFCVVVQGKPGSGFPPPPEGQLTDLGSGSLKFSSADGWAVSGTLAVQLEGQWVYGVLRRVDGGR